MESPFLALLGFAGTMLIAGALAAVALWLTSRIHVASPAVSRAAVPRRRWALIRVFSVRRLVGELARDALTPREKAYYLLGGWLLYSLIPYTWLTFSNAGSAWLGFYEFLVVAVFAVVGMYWCYEAGGGDDNPTFLVDFTCLLLPVTAQVYALVWGLYWALTWPYRLIADARIDDPALERLVVTASAEANWFMIFIAVASSQALLFIRIRKHMLSIASIRGTSNSNSSGRESATADPRRSI